MFFDLPRSFVDVVEFSFDLDVRTAVRGSDGQIKGRRDETAVGLLGSLTIPATAAKRREKGLPQISSHTCISCRSIVKRSFRGTDPGRSDLAIPDPERVLRPRPIRPPCSGSAPYVAGAERNPRRVSLGVCERYRDRVRHPVAIVHRRPRNPLPILCLMTQLNLSAYPVVNKRIRFSLVEKNLLFTHI